MSLDCVLIHPGAQHGIYGPLAVNLTAVEPPTWCRMIAGWLRDHGYSVAIIDQEAEQLNAGEVGDRVQELGASLAAIVVAGHQPSGATQQMTSAGEIARELPIQTRSIMLGNHPSALPMKTFIDECADFVCDGEGPLTIKGLLDGDGYEAIPGLVYDSTGARDSIHRNPPAPLIPIDGLHGDVWDLLPMNLYRAHQWQCLDDFSKRQPYASIYTTLGCPHSCSFCMINVFQHANAYRRRNPQKVVAEIVRLYHNYGVRTLKFADEMFVLHRQHVTDICNGLIQSGIAADLNIWSYSRIDSVFPDLLSLMRKAGFRWLALGIESASAYVRDGAEKRLKTDDIAGTVRMIQEAGINVIGNYMFGLPDDDMASMQATLDLAKELQTEWANFYSTMAYPGSRLYDEAIEKGWTLPQTWRGYSQHNNECRPLDTQYVDGLTVRAFRDAAFHDYFSHEPYLASIARKFGPQARQHIEEMATIKLERD